MASRSSKQGFNLNMGEVGSDYSANLSNSMPLSAKKISNAYWEQNSILLRPSTGLIGAIPLNPGDILGKTEISEVRKWALVPVISTDGTAKLYLYENLASDPTLTMSTGALKMGAMLSLFDAQAMAPRVPTQPWETGAVIPSGSVSDVAKEIRFLEVDSSLFKQNTCNGVSGILIFGLDKIYYLDDRKQLLEFKILIGQTSSVAGTLASFSKPICGILFQRKFFLMGVGVNLNTGASISNDEIFFYSSMLNEIENFRITEDLNSSPPLPGNYVAFAKRLMLDPGEKMLNLNTFLNRIVLATTRSVFSISSGSMDDDFIGENTFSKIKVSNVGCYSSDIILFETMMIYPSLHGIRQQSNGGMMLKYFQLIDQKSNVYTNIKPHKLVQDATKATVLTILDDGTVKSLFYGQGLEGPLSMTTYYESEVRPCLSLGRTPSAVFDIIVAGSQDGTAAYVLQEMNEVSGRDMVHDWNPTVTISNVVGQQFTATFTNVRDATGMVGMWFRATTSSNDWHYALRTNSTSNTYAVVSMITGDSFVPVAGTYPMYPHTTNLSNQLTDFDLSLDTPTAEGLEGLRVDVCVSGSNFDNTVVDDCFLQNPYTPFSINDKQGFYGTISIEISVWSKFPAIEWFSGASYRGAPIIMSDFILIANSDLHNCFDVLCERANIPSMESEESSYYSYKFVNSANTGDNITQVYFVNKRLGKGAAVNQMFFLGN